MPYIVLEIFSESAISSLGQNDFRVTPLFDLKLEAEVFQKYWF